MILSAGGTGGHLFPAQAVADELQKECELLFVAGGLKSCRYFKQELYPYKEVNAATFSFSHPASVMRGGWKVCQGAVQSLRILDEFSPDLVVGFGSFLTLPLLMAARLRRIPIILHEQNALPGKVNRLFSSYAKTTAITFPESEHYLKGKQQRVAFPLRVKQGGCPWEYFDLEKGKRTILIFGGSQGARRLNEVVLENSDLLQGAQVIHCLGKHGSVEEAKKIYQSHGIKHSVSNFEHRFDLALEAADLAICRAGASTIAELIEAEVPGILIPFPFASENHQENNARFFVETVGGGQMVIEKDLDRKTLNQSLSSMKLDSCIDAIGKHKSKQQLKDFKSLIIENL